MKDQIADGRKSCMVHESNWGGNTWHYICDDCAKKVLGNLKIKSELEEKPRIITQNNNLEL